MDTRSDHRIMLSEDNSGGAYLVLRLRDRTAKDHAATGAWTNPADATSDDKELSLTSSAKEHLAWTFDAASPGTLVIGVQSDESKSSHKQGAGIVMHPIATLLGVRRSQNGKFSVASGDEGKGWLKNQNRLIKAGAIRWSAVRYER